MSVSRKLYQERKNKNLCTICGEIAKKDRTLCEYHLQKANKNQKSRLAQLRNEELCVRCGQKLTNNRKTCNTCLEKIIPNHKRADIWIPWADRNKLGLCISCGKSNSTSNQRCKKCCKKYNITVLSTRKQRIANGLCGICGKGLLSKDMKNCIICVYKRNKKYTELKGRVIKSYGNKCNCCGETEKTFLSIDHINNDGNVYRKSKKFSGNNFYRWIINNNFPKDLQLLCHNCNMSKYLNGGICAHKFKQNGV